MLAGQHTPVNAGDGDCAQAISRGTPLRSLMLLKAKGLKLRGLAEQAKLVRLCTRRGKGLGEANADHVSFEEVSFLLVSAPWAASGRVLLREDASLARLLRHAVRESLSLGWCDVARELRAAVKSLCGRGEEGRACAGGWRVRVWRVLRVKGLLGEVSDATDSCAGVSV